MNKKISELKIDINVLKKYLYEKKSISEIARLFDIHRDTLVRYLNLLNIEYHGEKYSSRDINDYLSNKIKITASSLRKKLIENNLKEEKCECCGLTEWMGYKIPLELHHKNGNHNDNTLDNLEILCSNCHSIKHGYSMLKKYCKFCGKEFYTNIKQQKFCCPSCKTKFNCSEYSLICKFCGKEFISNRANAKYCSRSCSSKAQEHLNITKEELINDFKIHKTYVGVGNKYNVSDKAVYKWCKKFGLPTSAKDMKSFLNEINN